VWVSGTSETHLFRRISSNPVAVEILKPKQGSAGVYTGKPNSSSADPDSNQAKVHVTSKDILRSSKKSFFGLRFRSFMLGNGAEAETA
jgi:hypothetical protein